jgi:MoxR-like ATPase
MKASTRKLLPFAPLLRSYLDAGLPTAADLTQMPEVGPRFAAIEFARESLLSERFLDHAAESEFQTALLRFCEGCIEPALAEEIIRRRAGMVRHALNHLLRCTDPLPQRVERCLAPDGPYHVAELGLDFWSALFQALDPSQNPGWTPTLEAGVRRLGLARWRDHARTVRVYAALLDLYGRLRGEYPKLTAQHWDHFFTLVGRMQGRDLWTPGPATEERSATRTRFGGFCAETFRFLDELARNNLWEWMEQERERYQFAVREPLVELCKALAERYVVPVLNGDHGWDLETAARGGRSLSSVCKNDYGRSVPYQDVLWITFHRRACRDRSESAQFFVRLSASGLSYGVRVGPEARETLECLRRNIENHGELVLTALRRDGALRECRFEDGQETIADAADLAEWTSRPVVVAAKFVPAGSPLLLTDELVGDILLTFDRLLPVFACAVENDPLPVLVARAGVGETSRRYTASDFQRETHLDSEWVGRTLSLLSLKKQLILQGVPGTGKTHVARCLARLLAGGREDAVRLVQFHPAYSYEEFVEGIRVRSVETDGRHDLTYPVEDGVLAAFAAQAARRPSEPFVLLIDEINRGNLPRIFGELLYLLEYREQSVTLPYSKRDFSLPANLVVLATMNAADRSVALVDHALRRRFSFLEMQPDSAVLRAWFDANPPRQDLDLAERVPRLLERLNTQLRADLGAQYQVGHSYFMVPNLDEVRLRAVWKHHVEPLLAEWFAAHSGRLHAYTLAKLGGLDQPEKARRANRLASVVGQDSDPDTTWSGLES